MTQPTTTPLTLESLKQEAMSELRKAEKAIYAWACECDVGPERTRAFALYEIVRTAPRASMP